MLMLCYPTCGFEERNPLGNLHNLSFYFLHAFQDPHNLCHGKTRLTNNGGDGSFRIDDDDDNNDDDA